MRTFETFLASGSSAIRAAVAFAIAGLLAAGPAAALPPPEDKGNWDFDLALYGWVPDITGTVGVGGVTGDFEPYLWEDIIKGLKGALFTAGEVRYQNRWILNVDLAFAQVEFDREKGPFPVSFGGKSLSRDLGAKNGSIPVNTPIGDLEVPARFDPGTLSVDIPQVNTAIGAFDIDLKLTEVITRGFIGYRALDRPLFEETDPRRVRFDLLAGLRYYWIKMEVDIEAPPVEIPAFTVNSSLSGGSVRVGGDRLPGRSESLGTVNLPGIEFSGATLGGTDISVEATDWWIDPIVGARVGVDVSEKLSLTLMGNIGGFGIGSASEFSWETTVFGTYSLGEHWHFAAGYRALGFDYKGGDVDLDLIEHGPVLGFIYRF